MRKGKIFSGCLKTEEIVNAERLWLRHVQKHVATISNIDLMENGVGILRVGSRIPDYRPIFVPKGCILDRTLVRHLHEQIVNHGQSKRTVLDTTIKSVSEKRYPRLQTNVTDPEYDLYTHHQRHHCLCLELRAGCSKAE